MQRQTHDAKQARQSHLWMIFVLVIKYLHLAEEHRLLLQNLHYLEPVHACNTPPHRSWLILAHMQVVCSCIT